MDGRLRLAPAPFSTLEARRICLIKPSSLGDIIQALPILSVLRERFPRAHLSWLCNTAYAPLLRPISLLDDVIEFPRERFRKATIRSALELRRFCRQLEERQFDLAIDLQGLFRSGWLARATRASNRLGLTSARELAGVFYTDVVDDLPIERGAVERYWSIARALGMGEAPIRYPLELSPDERAWARQMIAHRSRPILSVNAGARWLTKRWPPERFAQAARTFLKHRGGSVVLVGGPGEEPQADVIAKELGSAALNLCGKTSLRQLAALLEACDLMLTNDSGPLHLAAAVGTPSVSIFTCTSPERAAPRGEAHRFVQTSVSCRSSYLKTCDRLDCMKELTADRVIPLLLPASVEPTNGRHAA